MHERHQSVLAAASSMCFNCCVIGDVQSPDWMRWEDHPVRKEYDIVMDLGEGAFSQVRTCMHAPLHPCMSGNPAIPACQAQGLLATHSPHTPCQQGAHDLASCCWHACSDMGMKHDVVAHACNWFRV